MVRNYKRKGTYNKWDEDQMEKAIQSVIKGVLSVRRASEHFKVPFETLRKKVHLERFKSSLGEDNEMVQSVMPKSVGHPTILNADQESDLVRRILNFANKGLGCTPQTIRKAVYRYVTVNKIPHPWGNSREAGMDWFTAFMKRNSNFFLSKPEGLSKARAEGINKAVTRFFNLLQSITSKGLVSI